MKIQASESVEVSGTVPGSRNPSLIDSSANILDKQLRETFNLPPSPSGGSGDLTINTPVLRATDGGLVSVGNEGSGDAGTGTLKIDADRIFLNNSGGITAATVSDEGGNIILRTEDLRLRQGSNITATASGTADGGNIEIDTNVLTALENSNIEANAFQGRGGKIDISATGIFLSPNSEITADSQLGIDGSVRFNIPNINFARAIAKPAETPQKPEVYSPCANNSGAISTLTSSGRGGVPATSSNLPSSYTGWHNDSPKARSRPSPQTKSTPKQITEAQGWKTNPDGTIGLTVNANKVVPYSSWSKPYCFQRKAQKKTLTAQATTPNSNSNPFPLLPLPFPNLPSPNPSAPPARITPAPSPLLPEVPQTDERTIRVKRFVFEGNTVFSDRALQKVVAPLVGREITFAQLLQARAAVTDFYVDAGYRSSGAFIPIPSNQNLRPEGAVVTIQVIESKLEQINVSGSDRLTNYIRSRIEAASGAVVKRNRLLEALRLLQADPLIENIKADLAPGSRPGRTILNVSVQPTPPFQVEAIFNNYRSPAVGSFQEGIQLSHANLLGLGDKLSLSYRNTEGSDTFQGSYELPINPSGTVAFAFANSDSNIIEEPFNELDILSDSQYYRMTFRQPLFRRATEEVVQEFAVGLTASRTESQGSFLNGEIPFPVIGADSEGQTSITALRFFQHWRQESGREIFAARSQFSLGIGALDATINSTPPDSRFFAWQGQVSWLRELAENLALRAQTSLQLADRPLVPLEQFDLGGPTSVRGYRQNALLSDNGFRASLELGIQVASGSLGDFQMFPFFDVGTVWNNGNGEDARRILDANTLASVGLGLQYRLGQTLTARLEYGIPLVSPNGEGDSLQEQGISFSLQFFPF